MTLLFKIILLLSLSFIEIQCKLSEQPERCEVCIHNVEKISKEINSTDSQKDIMKKVKVFCKDQVQKDEKFCFMIGAHPESATSNLVTLARPLGFGMPADKICDKLELTDKEICKLKYERDLDLSMKKLKTYKIKQLKNILGKWNVKCKGCLEKADFIEKITELRPKYDKTYSPTEEL